MLSNWENKEIWHPHTFWHLWGVSSLSLNVIEKFFRVADDDAYFKVSIATWASICKQTADNKSIQKAIPHSRIQTSIR